MGNRQAAEEAYQQLLDLSHRVVQILTTVGHDDFIRWDSSLTVGVKTFDQHHMKLIGLINKLYVTMESGEGDEVLRRTLAETCGLYGLAFCI